MTDPEERLRAGDPGRGYEADLDAIRARVDADLGAPAGGTVTPLRPRRPRWQLAAAAAAGLLLAGAGYAAGALGGAGPAPGAAPSAGPGADERVVGHIPADPGPAGVAPAEIAPDSASMARALPGIAPAFGRGNLVFTGDGLSEARGSAHAYALAAPEVTPELAGALADALGIGEPTRTDAGGYELATENAWLSIGADGAVSFNHSDRSPWTCADLRIVETMPEVVAPAAGEDTPRGGSTPPDPGRSEPADPRDCGPRLSGDDAIERARGIVDAAGFDADQYAWTAPAEPFDGTVEARLELPGAENAADLPVAWSFTVGDQGIAGLWAQPGELVDLGSYETVSPAVAATRLNERRFAGGALGYVQAMPLVELPLAGPAESGPAAATEGAGGVDRADRAGRADRAVSPAPGDLLPWEVRSVVLTHSEASWQQTRAGDGGRLLLPAYRLTDSDGATWSVVAVAEERLELVGGP
ncbi:hypothetical protein [Pseudactinotalea sp. HY158]|uniref:hypothetical protein n=1 Tax=Pseudactinotalea sp. HY158 TaxID=2654547 RepID=UPI00129C9C6B|nr:hypothetical protein [Pseudactinotalea sp. HY158]QGH68396.1 hypothetical protein GCE65_01895 [Pseudactinotalea sp. HY158]